MLLLVLICVVAISVAGVDAVLSLYNWQARIHIGRWNDRIKWQDAIRRKAQLWLNRTPVVPLTDEGRYVLLDLLRGRFLSNTIQSWQTAGLIIGLGRKEAEKYISRNPYSFSIDSHEIDGLLLAYALKVKGLLTEEQETVVIDSIDSLTDSGTIPYRKNLQNIRFVDTLGFVCPILYATGRDKLSDEVIAEFDPFLLDGAIPPHAISLKDQVSLGIYGWGRGIGWYIIALISSADSNVGRILSLADYLLKYQRDDGCFGWSILDRGSRKESSGTALIGLLFISAFKHSRKIQYLDAARRIETALMSMTRRDGAVDYAQGDTHGIGMYSMRYGTMPFVQGIALRFTESLDEAMKLL